MILKTCRAILIFLISICGAELFSGCTTLSDASCPYIISDVEMQIGESENICQFANANFQFFNNSNKSVKNFTVSFHIFDESGENPFFGTNKVTAFCDEEIGAGEIRRIFVPMDSFLQVAPEKPFELDYFYVRKINYIDGSSWEDYFGLYAGVKQ